jgi:hypothetical protein
VSHQSSCAALPPPEHLEVLQAQVGALQNKCMLLGLGLGQACMPFLQVPARRPFTNHVTWPFPAR